MKIVKFENGKFAIRKFTIFGWQYKDLRTGGLWWNQSSVWFSDCLGTYDECAKQFTGNGIVVR